MLSFPTSGRFLGLYDVASVILRILGVVVFGSSLFLSIETVQMTALLALGLLLYIIGNVLDQSLTSFLRLEPRPDVFVIPTDVSRGIGWKEVLVVFALAVVTIPALIF